MAHKVEILGVDDDSPYLVPLNSGWRRELILRRNSSSQHADVYYVPPKGKRCRSLNDVKREILNTGLSLEHFTFIRKMLGVNDPTKELVRAAKGKPFDSSSLNQSRKAVVIPTKIAKKTPVKIEPLLTEPTSAGVTTEFEGVETFEEDVSSSVLCDHSSENNSLKGSQVSLLRCFCGLCSSLDAKNVCCWDVSNIQTVKSDYQCITLHSGFEKLVLDTDVLSITRHFLSVKTKNKNKKNLLSTDIPLNITWRYVAYKQFVSWVNCCTTLGCRNPVAIPSCVVNAIKERYPEQNGNHKVLKFSSQKTPAQAPRT